MKTLVSWALNRLAENSTWRGIILLLTAAGVAISPEQAAAITSAGLALVGLINVIRKAPNAPDNNSSTGQSAG